MAEADDLRKRIVALLARGGLAADIARQIRSVSALRPLRVILHILEHGQVSTEELTEKFGYNQPPRAARDVRECGIALVTKSGKTKDGRRMAVYVIDSETAAERHKSGRQVFAKAVKAQLVEALGERCTLCRAKLPSRLLQVDHRVPFQIAGELAHGRAGPETLMLLCPSCNRRKSWDCEHCPNWGRKNVDVCQSCYWSGNLEYKHIATREMRHLSLTFQDEEVAVAEWLTRVAAERGLDPEAVVKALLRGASDLQKKKGSST